MLTIHHEALSLAHGAASNVMGEPFGVHVREGIPRVYFTVDTAGSNVSITVRGFWTGQPLRDDIREWDFLGTIEVDGIVCHYFIDPR